MTSTSAGTNRNVWYVLMVIGAVVAVFSLTKGSFTYTLTSEEAQQFVDEGLVSHNETNPKITLTDANVSFVGDEILVKTYAQIGNTFGKASGGVSARGKIEYRRVLPFDGEFYFLPTATPEVFDVSVETISPNTIESPLPTFTKTLRERAEKFVEKHELTESVDALKSDVSALLRKQSPELTSAILTNRPMLQLSQIQKGWVVAGVLDDVTVVDGKLLITVSAIQLGWTILISLIMLIVGIAGAVPMFHFPLLGMLSAT